MMFSLPSYVFFLVLIVSMVLEPTTEGGLVGRFFGAVILLDIAL